MTFKEYLIGLEWFSFSRYPEQGSNIYLHLFAPIGHQHKFIKIQNFNAVLFEPRKFFETLKINDVHWQLTWLPCESINEF